MIIHLLLLAIHAHADLGPKPQAYFFWKDLKGIEQSSLQLMQCEDKTCKNAEPLKSVGPQGFSCCDHGCYAMAYGFSKFFRLEAKTSKGKGAKSNVLEMEGMENFLELSMKNGQLTVTPSASLTEDEKQKIMSCRYK